MLLVNYLLRKCFPHISLCIPANVTIEEWMMLDEVERILVSKRYEIAQKLIRLDVEEREALLNGDFSEGIQEYVESLVSVCAECFPDLRRELILQTVRTYIIIGAV